jgi:hypothetical protein
MGMRARLLCAALISIPAAALAADGVERNLLERQQREADFHVKLFDTTPPRPMAHGPQLPLPLETAPRSTQDLGEPLPPNPTRAVPSAPGPDTSRLHLDLSQQYRQEQLQQQSQPLEDALHPQQSQILQQQLQTQQLQFDRENRSQGLSDRILRESQGAMRQTR